MSIKIKKGDIVETESFWFAEGENEINLRTECKEITINTGHNQTVKIDKTYAPTIFCDIRITPVLETCTWKIERLRITSDENGNEVSKWEVVSEFDAQECIEFNEE